MAFTHPTTPDTGNRLDYICTSADGGLRTALYVMVFIRHSDDGSENELGIDPRDVVR